MTIKTTYIGTLNGVHGVWCGFLPEGAVVEEERYVLYPEAGYQLQRKSDKERLDYVWLHDGDTQENYTEIEIIEVGE